MPSKIWIQQYKNVRKREDGSPERRIVTVNGVSIETAEKMRQKKFGGGAKAKAHCLDCGVRLFQQEFEKFGLCCYACY